MSDAAILVEPTAEAAARRAAEVFKSLVTAAVSENQVCHVALSGGTTPRSTFQCLAAGIVTDNLPWGEIELFFGDERDVPHDDVESNYHMAQRALLDHIPINWSRVHPMQADAEDIDAAAAEYEQTIRRQVPAGADGVPRFDLMMLGLGGDGHTASLFPGSPLLDEKRRLVAGAFVPVLGRRRMSVTFPLINASRNILLQVTGDDKAEIARRVLTEHDLTLPAAHIQPTDGQLHVVLDQAAARLL